MKKSLYRAADTRLDRLKNRGYNYEGKIFQRSMSPYLFRDPNRADILSYMERMIFFLVEKAKSIKTFYNYTVDKDETRIN